MIMDLATGGELFNLVTKNPGDCATESEIKRMLTNMFSAVRLRLTTPKIRRYFVQHWMGSSEVEAQQRG